MSDLYDTLEDAYHTSSSNLMISYDTLARLSSVYDNFNVNVTHALGRLTDYSLLIYQISPPLQDSIRII